MCTPPPHPALDPTATAPEAHPTTAPPFTVKVVKVPKLVILGCAAVVRVPAMLVAVIVPVTSRAVVGVVLLMPT